MRNLFRRTACIAALITMSAVPLAAQSGAGAYLAARQAALSSDFDVAAQYYTQALVRNPNDPELLESAALAQLSLGRIDNAYPMAQQIEAAGLRSQIAHMIVVAKLSANEDYAAILDRDSQKQGIGPLVDGLVEASARLVRALEDLRAPLKELRRILLDRLDDAHRTVELAPHHGPNHAALGDAERALGRTDRAEAAYRAALERGADIVVMIHPDYQYDARALPAMVTFLRLGTCDVVLGSRIRTRREALEGGMPLWKYVANRFLTFSENLVLGQNVGELRVRPGEATIGGDGALEPGDRVAQSAIGGGDGAAQPNRAFVNLGGAQGGHYDR